jgi:hypothetical protein
VTLATLGWADWLAIAAFGVSAVSLGVSIYFAWRNEQRAERAELRDEERVERERQEADAANRARLSIWANGSGSTGDHRRFAFIIRNHGKVTAHDVHVWVYDEDGNDRSIIPQPAFDVKPDESVDNHAVVAPLDVQPEDVRFAYRWFDGAGHHKALSHIPPTL